MSEFVGQDQDNKHDNKDQAPEPDPKKARVRKLSQTQELKAITQDSRSASVSGELARQVPEMRDNSKALGIPTAILDEFANNA